MRDRGRTACAPALPFPLARGACALKVYSMANIETITEDILRLLAA